MAWNTIRREKPKLSRAQLNSSPLDEESEEAYESETETQDRSTQSEDMQLQTGQQEVQTIIHGRKQQKTTGREKVTNILLPKPEKIQPSSGRPISLLPTTGKIAERIID